MSHQSVFPLVYRVSRAMVFYGKNKKRGLYFRKILFRYVCDSGRIQTCNLLIRSQMLYSVELRSQTLLLCGSVVP